MTLRLTIALLLVTGAGLTACSSSERQETVTERQAAPAPAESTAATPATPSDTAQVSAAGVEVRPAEVDGILAAVRGSGRKAVVLNVWATWCIPCREEFPDLMRMHREYKDRGVDLMLVSTDFDDRLPAVKQFLSGHGVDFPSWIKEGDDMKFINALSPEWTGALPATFIYDGEGKLKFFHEGKITYSMLEQQVLEIVNGPAPVPAKEERT